MTEDTSRDDTKSIPGVSGPIEVARRLAQHDPRIGQAPEQIGPYKILSELGQGGMGVVYLAEQTKPIHRRVALKIIKLGMDTKQVVARFETEREALALMNHPNVARVFDAGATEQGRPYFAMEYVQGIPITQYCDKHRLNTEERLRLFTEVCNAIQHAHQKGIIHRDIKPSNVLVAVQDDNPVPKVIDFGVAKATQHRLTEQPVFTEQGQLVGTPGYMSPEQAEMTALDVDTRTDVYSLGVLLYELLVGALPFENKTLLAGGLGEIQRIIREVEPQKPSTRLSNLGDDSTAVAHQRHTEPKTLIRQLRGDLDWIVMKCLEKDRTRRYDTANTLAMEIGRFLNNEPVLAGPPSASYRFRKFTRRNKGAVTAVAAVAAALLIGVIGFAWQAKIARDQRNVAVLAQKAEADARRLAELKQNEAAAARAEADSKAAEATEAAERERIARRMAQRETENLRRVVYRNQITLADVAYRENNSARMQEILGACPEDLRGWEWAYLVHQADRSIQTYSVHAGVHPSIAFSPDGSRIAWGGQEKTTEIWNVGTGQRILTLHGHEHSKPWSLSSLFDGLSEEARNADEIRTLCFSANGKRIVSGRLDGTLEVWNAETGEEVVSQRVPGGPVQAVALSRDATQLAHGSYDAHNAFDGSLRVWTLGLRSVVPRFEKHLGNGQVLSIAFSPDGSRMVSGTGSNSGCYYVLDPVTGKRVLTLQGNTVGTNCVAFSMNGKWIVGGKSDGTLSIWDAESGDAVRTLSGHASSVLCVAFSPDGARIASGSLDRTLRLWDAHKGTELATLRGHTDSILSVAFSPDSQQVFSGSEDGTWKTWDARSEDEVLTLRGHTDAVLSVAFSPDGKRIASGGKDWTLKIWNADTGEETVSGFVRRGFFGSSWAFDAAFSSDGKRIVFRDLMNIRIWDAEAFKEARSFPGITVRSIAISPDGKRIVEGAMEGRLWISDLDTGKTVVTMRGRHAGVVRSVGFSMDGKRIVAGSEDKLNSGTEDNTLKVWDVESGDEVYTLRGHSGFVTSVAYSPDNRRIVSGHRDGMARVWDTETAANVATLRGHVGSITSVAFTPDGKRIVSAGDDRTVKIWDADTGEEMLTLRGHSGEVSSLSISPDGKRIASGSADGTVKVWDARITDHALARLRHSQGG